MRKQNLNRETRRSLAKDKKKSTMRNVFIRVSKVNHTKNGEVIYTKEDIHEILDSWSKKKKMSYYFIEHNEDEENVHYHIVLEFAHPTDFDTIKKKFPYGNIRECLKSYDGKSKIHYSVRYLTHADHPAKHQYGWEEVITNNASKLEDYKVPHALSMKVRLKNVIDQIIAGEIKEFEIDKIDSDLYIHKNNALKKAFEYRAALLNQDPNRNIIVVGCIGAPRVGKTTFMKEYAKKQNMSYCLSSASNDVWSSYKSQDAFLLDDANFDNIKIEDMMKMLDPLNNTGNKSRYYNKFFVGDIIVVISNIPIQDWYWDEESVHREALLKRFDYFFDFNVEQTKLDEHISRFRICKFTGEYKGFDEEYGMPYPTSYKRYILTPIEDDEILEFDMTDCVDFSSREKKLEAFLASVRGMCR